MDSAENQILFYKPLRRIFMKKSTAIARIAIFFAVMLTIHFVTSFILEFVPSGIQPTFLLLSLPSFMDLESELFWDSSWASLV